MRTHVGQRKYEALESVEETSGVPLTDGAWNALAELTVLQILEVEIYIREIRKAAEHGVPE